MKVQSANEVNLTSQIGTSKEKSIIVSRLTTDFEFENNNNIFALTKDLKSNLPETVLYDLVEKAKNICYINGVMKNFTKD